MEEEMFFKANDRFMNVNSVAGALRDGEKLIVYTAGGTIILEGEDAKLFDRFLTEKAEAFAKELSRIAERGA
jgi:hypothetical protein